MVSVACALALSAASAPAAHAERFAIAFGDDVVNDGNLCTVTCQPGRGGIMAGDLNAPAGAAVVGGEMFVPEAFGNRVSVFDVQTGAFLRAFGRNVGGENVNTCTTTCYAGMSVFCLPGHPFPCTKFDVGYLYDGMMAPDGIAALGNELFIPEDQSLRVSVWDAATGAFVRAFGAGVGGPGVDTCTGSACQQAAVTDADAAAVVRNPSGIAIDDGKAYVTDRGNARVSVFNAATGVFLFAFGKDVGGTGVDTCTATCQKGTVGDGAGELDGVGGLAAGGGQVFVPESFNNRVSVFDAATGAFVRAFGNDVGGPGADTCTTSCHAGGAGDGAGQILIPNGAAIDGDQLLVTESFNHRVSFFSLASGAFVRAVGKDVGGSGVDSCTTSCQVGTADGGAGRLDSPANATVAGERLIVPDAGDARVSVLDAQTGAFRYATGTSTQPGGGDELERCRAICQRAGAGANRSPQGLAVAGGELFVTEAGAQRIGVFDAATGNFLRALGRDVGGPGVSACTDACQNATVLGDGAAGELISPFGVAAADGKLFVTDAADSRVSVLDAATGAFVRAFGSDVGGAGVDVCTTSCQPGTPGDGAAELTQPLGIAVAGGEVFVVDQALRRVSVYDAATGSFARAFGKDVGGSGVDSCTATCHAGSAGGAAGQLQAPTGIAVAGDEVFVTDGLPNNRIAVFDRTTGAFLRAYGKGVGGAGVDVCTTTCQRASPLATDFVGAGGLNSPTAAAVAGGELLVADFANNRVSVFDAATGVFRRAFGRDVGGFGVDTCTATCGPGNITADTTGDAFSALFPSDGPARELLFPFGVAVAGNGVFVSEGGNGRVSVFTASSDVTAPDTAITSGPSGPTNDATPPFGFTSPDGGVDFECRVGAAGYRDCASVFTTAPLTDGSHTFAVRAIDAAWNYDATPATRSFVVDTAPPATADDVPLPFTTPLAVTLAAVDTGTGVDQTYYTKGVNPPVPTTASALYDPAAKPSLNPGERIYYFSTDKAGNAEVPHLSRLNECADGVDNDRNGARDFPEDGGCISATDPTEAFSACPGAVLTGTIQGNRLAGGAGDDCIHGLGGVDSLNGRGGSDQVYGDDGDDEVAGGDGADAVYGGSGADSVFGGAGADFVSGGPGRDRLYGGATDDGDATGDDRFFAADNTFDHVYCGDGSDTAYIDADDGVTGCETVYVRTTGAGGRVTYIRRTTG
jgi:hypothetical protein